PAAIAAALIDEGCVGEGVAATTVELAARACEDAEIRAALERIAADERRHAALAWASLRWLLDHHPGEVQPAVRERAATLRERAMSSDPVQRAIVIELVAPLLETMLDQGAETAITDRRRCTRPPRP
ncbi:MAG TPA: hypothetical protein VK034_29475, partial [Enhygromyxa sp.]|nr:hypothetical protein [Enhygromyxa sp.]